MRSIRDGPADDAIELREPERRQRTPVHCGDMSIVLLGSDQLSLWSLALLVQVAAAAACVRVCARSIAPNLHRATDERSALDSLGPLALMLPMIPATWRIGFDAGTPIGWISMGGPIVIALIGLGAASIASALIFQRGQHDDPWQAARAALPLSAIAAWSVAGGLLLLVGAAHDLTMWMGQCAFAAGATLLWLNTPDLSEASPSHGESESERVIGGGLTLLLLLGAVQAAALAVVPVQHLPISATLAIASGGMCVAAMARVVSPAAAARLGGWTATYGVLLGLGALSLRYLLPTIPAVVRGGRQATDLPPRKIAFGFGEFAPEAIALMLLGAAATGVLMLRGVRLRMILGAAIILLAALLAGWRLTMTG